ncbi:hypothetical protein JCM10212_004990 [Sporobolomyces blumeae]
MAPNATRAPPSTEPVVQRVHVGGLAPSVTPRDLVNRFSSFGTVQQGERGIQGLGTTPNGAPRSYAFFSLETTPAKFYRCVSMLNGSMWKSHKLKIGPAKPTWQERLNPKQSTPSSIQPKPKKRKRPSRDPDVGYAATRFEVVTPDNISKHRGWVLDAKPHHAVPLFPLVCRPAHPIYLAPKPTATSWTRGKARSSSLHDVESKKKNKASTTTTMDKEPLRRIKRIRIDPRRYGRKKVVFGSTAGSGRAGNDEDESSRTIRVGQWECEDAEDGAPHDADADDDDDDEDDGVGARTTTTTDPRDRDEVTWVFRARDGSVKRRETVRLNPHHRMVAHTDQFTALLEKLENPKCSIVPPLPPTTTTRNNLGTKTRSDQDAKKRSTTQVPSTDPDEASLTAPASSSSSLAAGVAVDKPTPGSSPRVRVRPRSLSPPPYVPSAPRTLLYNEEDAFQLVESSLDDRERARLAQQERDRLVKLAKGFVQGVEEGPEVERKHEKKEDEGRKVLPKVEGFANDDSDDDDVFEVLRLRGGGGVSSASDSEEDDSSESESDSDDDDDDVVVEGSKEPKGDSKNEAKAKTSLAKESLKDMFKPQEESAGFSLMSGLDLDLDLEDGTVRSPTPEPSIPIPSALPAPPPKVLPMYRPRPGRPGPDQVHQTPLQGPSQALFGFLNGVEGTDARARALGANEFWKSQTPEEIEADHAALRETLRGFARKRHREAVKRTKKRVVGGAGSGSAFGAGGAGGGGGGGRRGASSVGGAFTLDVVDA